MPLVSSAYPVATTNLIPAKPGLIAELCVPGGAETSRQFLSELVNGWNIKPCRVNGEVRIEIIGPDYRNQTALESDGVFVERISWATRFFVPTGHKAVEVLGRVVTAKPIVEGVRIRG